MKGTLLLLLYATAGTYLCFTVYIFVPFLSGTPSARQIEEASVFVPLVVDLGVLCLFIFQHSFFATRIEHYGVSGPAICVFSTCIGLQLWMKFWQVSGYAVWMVDRSYAYYFYYLQCWNWAHLLRREVKTLWGGSRKIYNKIMGHESGNSKPRADKHTGSYYFFLALGIVPTMTLDRALLLAVMYLYIRCCNTDLFVVRMLEEERKQKEWEARVQLEAEMLEAALKEELRKQEETDNFMKWFLQGHQSRRVKRK